MARQAIQSTEHGYTVIQEPLTRNGGSIGFYGNFREDTGACLGVTSEKYGLIQNTALLEAATAALATRGLTDYKQRIVVTGNGERMYAEFSFENKQLAADVGDVFGYRLTLKNSFDRSLRAGFALGFIRLVCKNGASTLEKEFAITQKHSSKVSVEFIGKAVDAALANGQKALGTYNMLSKVAVTDEQGINILKQLEAGKVLSGVLRQSMETLWLAPRRTEDKARNLYNLYNAVTEHLTHQVADSRFEYAGEVSNNVLFKLYNAARNPAKLASLVLPLPKDVQVTVDNQPAIIEAEVVG